MSILNKLIRTWWIDKPIDNNIPTSCVFEESKPKIKTGPNREWIRVISLDDFHKEAGMNITRWVEVCNELSKEKKENEKLKKALEIAKEKLGFYADRNSWKYSSDDRFDCTITHKDASEVITGKQKDKVGGKRARQAFKEIEECLNA